MVKYARRLAADGRSDPERRAEMRGTSPKYIPREWMLAEAYTKAEAGDFSTLHELQVEPRPNIASCRLRPSDRPAPTRSRLAYSPPTPRPADDLRDALR